MKLSNINFPNIYIKLFIFLLLVLAAMQVYFFCDLSLKMDKTIHPERNWNRVIKIKMLKELMEEKIRLNNGFDPSKKALQELISRVSRLYNAQIWVEDANGIPILESFSPEKRPEKINKDFNLSSRYGDVSISHKFRYDIKTKSIYTDIPLDAGSGDGLSLHILYKGEFVPFRSQFMKDLSLIILLLVILALSLLQFIRIKIDRLRSSVLKIADGDLNHRVVVKGRGVFEDLGRAFNNMADKLEKMITSSKEITANVSHEIRTPLARIKVVESLMKKKNRRGDFSEFGRHLDSIRDDIQILDDLVGRLLEFVKLDSYQPTLKHEPFSPVDLMDDLLIRFEPMIELRSLHIQKTFSFSAAFSGDRSAVTSLFLNVLDNAVKYTPEHGTISIRMEPKAGFLQTRVINTFGKMDPAELENIFKPFERAKRTEGAGSGLGLAIAKKIAENHGGNIVALSSTEEFEIRIQLPL